MENIQESPDQEVATSVVTEIERRQVELSMRVADTKEVSDTAGHLARGALSSLRGVNQGLVPESWVR